MFASPRVNSIALHLAMTFAKEKWILRASARRGLLHLVTLYRGETVEGHGPQECERAGGFHA